MGAAARGGFPDRPSVPPHPGWMARTVTPAVRGTHLPQALGSLSTFLTNAWLIQMWRFPHEAQHRGALPMTTLGVKGDTDARRGWSPTELPPPRKGRRMTCDRCGMYYPETASCWGCMMGRPCDTPERCGTPTIHDCPEPYAPSTARMLLAVHRGGAPISQRRRAAILLGLEAAGDIERCRFCGGLHEPGPVGQPNSAFPGIEFKVCPKVPEGHIYNDHEYESGPRGQLLRISSDETGRTSE